jgi:RNA polymerase sigma-70 factor (ECF subfamily)
MEDSQMLKMIAKGDQQALAELYHRYESRVFRFLKSKLPDTIDAADIVNEVFMEVWKKAASFQQRSKVSTWLFSMAYFKAVDHLRKYQPEQLSDEHTAQLEDETPTALATLLSQQTAKQVHHCIETLKPDHQSVMQLTFFEELSYREIAEIMQCPENTIKTRMFHAKQAMKKCLHRLMGGLP